VFPTPRTFGEALEDPRFVMLSRYWLQLEQYLARFPSEQILVIDSDELLLRREETMSQVFGFLDVDPGFRSPGFELRHHVAAGHTRRNPLGHRTLSLLHLALGPERTASFAAKVPSPLKMPFRARVEHPVVDEAVRERLADWFEGDVRRLRAHTGLAFAGWSL
jgi:hypothetical protein